MCEKTCSLQHDEPENFDRSQWCPPNLVSGYYVVYRLVLASLFIGVIVVFIHLEFNDGQFFIFLTNQGLIFLTLHFSIDAILVLKRWVWEKLHSKHINYHKADSLSHIYKLSWALHSATFSIALGITLVYWSFLHKIVIENGMLNSTAAKLGNFVIHGCNTLACLLDIFISNRPWRPLHFFWPILFGLCYATFSLIYWGAGGLGMCFDEKPEEGVTVQVGDQWCAPYIYPEILDWETKPMQAVITIAGGCAVLPFLHFFWMLLAKLRGYLYYRSIQNTKQPLIELTTC